MLDNNKEKRQYQRVDRIIQVKYDYPENKSGLQQTSFTRDISAGGFMVRVKQNFPVGTELSLKFFVGTDEFIHSMAKVMWIKPVVEGRLYDVGLHLTEIKDSDRQLLIDYLDGK